MKKISYLGPKKTFTGEAARKIASNLGEETELMDLVSLDAVARSVASGQVDLGVMTYYNYLEGLVQECLDFIYENNLRITGMQRLPIIFNIGSHKDNADFGKIYSHPKALAQCSGWLWDHYPGSEQVPLTSTAASAKKVADERSGLAISSLDALNENGLEIIAQDIGNKKHGRRNFTDFYLVSKSNGHGYDPSREYLTMVAITPHIDEKGLLAMILQQVAFCNLNNAKIHSRPALDYVGIDGVEPQMFYLEITKI
jgi:prephenate dehydratase